MACRLLRLEREGLAITAITGSDRKAQLIHACRAEEPSEASDHMMTRLGSGRKVELTCGYSHEPMNT